MIIGDIQWLSPNNIGGWAVETHAPGKPIEVTLDNAWCGRKATLTATRSSSIPSPYGDASGFQMPISADEYRWLLRLICDGVRDIGLALGDGFHKRKLFVSGRLCRILREVAIRERLINFEVNEIVSVRDDGRTYLLGGSNSNRDYLCGERQLRPDVLVRWSEAIRNLSYMADGSGAAFTFVVVAAKEAIEFAGKEFELSHQRPIYQICNELDSFARSKLLYNRRLLFDFMPSERKFRSNDTHMNALGAFVTARGILDVLGIPLSMWPSVEDLSIFLGEYNGDLGRNTEAYRQSVEIDCHPIIKDICPASQSGQRRVNIDGTPRRLRIYGHSTAAMIMQIIGHVFDDAVFERTMLPNVTGLKPDEAIVVIVPERYLVRINEGEYKGVFDPPLSYF